MPQRAITPRLKLSTITSISRARSKTSSRPRSVWRLIEALFLARLSFTKLGDLFHRFWLKPPRWLSGCLRDSILSTSAPSSARLRATVGPAAPVHSSRTRMPVSGASIGLLLNRTGRVESGHVVGREAQLAHQDL